MYKYHGAGDRVVVVPDRGEASKDSITIRGVEVTAGERIIVHGRSTLPNGTCLGMELWADGEPQTWWPGEAHVPVQNGAWQFSVPLGQDGAPAKLDATVNTCVGLPVERPQHRFHVPVRSGRTAHAQPVSSRSLPDA